MTAVVLASASPRRRQLLAPLGLDITVMPADIDETEHPGEDPVAYVRRLAAEKCTVIADRLGAEGSTRLVIAADTTVARDGTILGKPTDEAEATAMLRSLGGRDHMVHTGVCVRLGDRTATGVETTVVRFVELSDRVVSWYVRTGEPFDKAGAYAIQEAGGVFVESVTGSVSNVVGLPLSLVIELAESVGVQLIG